MRMSRIFQASSLSSELELTLSAEAHNHISRVLRLPVGTTFHIFNGEEGEYKATIVATDKNKTIVHIGEFLSYNKESPLRLHLGQGISRGEKMDLVIQKAVELGVSQITPLVTQRCEVKLSNERWEKRQRHWQSIAIAACEQSGRNTIPVIAPATSLSSWISHCSSGENLLLHPHANKKLSDFAKTPTAINLLIGPEGGLDNVEINMAQHLGFDTVCLGPRVMRTETAAIAAIAILQNHFGDMN